MDNSISHNDFSQYLPERRRLHLLLLTQNTKQPAQEHWEIAAELTEMGMAHGNFGRESESGRREIFYFYNFTPTPQGRDYAEQLQSQAMMNSPQFKRARRNAKFLGWLAGIATSILTAILTEWSNGFVSRLLLAGC